MRYTQNGLQVSISELRQMLADAESEAKYNDKEACVYIKGGKKPHIIQYSNYAECDPVDHTFWAR